AYFCWLYKEVAAPERAPRGTRWLFTWKSDVVMAILLGLATFSKATNVLLFGAPALWSIVRWWRISRLKAGAIYSPAGTPDARSGQQIPIGRFFLVVATLVLVAGGLFAINMAISGEWNYQGGDRRS